MKLNAENLCTALDYFSPDGKDKAHIFMCYLSYLLIKTLEHMLKKGGLTMNAENALKQLSEVKHVVVTNPKGDITTSKISIPSTEQRQIMDVLEGENIKLKFR